MTITTIIDQLDTLITNSAPISRTKPLLMSLRAQTEAMESRVSTLESEAQTRDQIPLIESLRKDLEDATREIEQLKTAAKPKSTEKTNLPEPKHGILCFLNEHGNPSIQNIGQHLRMSEDGARFHLVELYDEQMVYPENFTDGRQNWCLGQPGKKYLHDRGLLR